MLRTSSRFILSGAWLVCILTLIGCSNNNIVLRYVTISPQSATGTVGAQVMFTATAYYSNGTTASGTGLVLWSSSNPAVATVVGGVATPLSNGTTTISAMASGAPVATATLTVNTTTSIAVTPANQTVPVGGSQQYDAVATFSDGSSNDVTTLATWSSGNTNAATIGASTGLAAVPNSATTGATSTITAALYGVTGIATLTVGAPAPVSLTVTPVVPTTANIALGNTATFTATENWSDGTTGHVPSGTVTWTSGTLATATILANATVSSNATALGVATGTSTITATEGTLTPGTATLTVVTGTSHFAYVANASGTGSSTPPSSISEYSVNATSTTAPFVSIGSVAQNTGPGQVVLHPSGQYLYSIDTAGFILVYDVNSQTGALTVTSQPPVQLAGIGLNNPSYGIVDPYGRFLYVVNFTTSTIYAFEISPTDGSLSNGTTVTTNVNSPTSAMVDKTGSFLYVINTGNGTVNGTVSGYAITQTSGALTPLSTPTFNTGLAPLYATIDPSGTYLIVANNGSATVTGSVSVFTIGSNGLLTGGTQTTITGSINLFNVAVDPSGTHLYVLDSGSANGQVYGYTFTGGVLGSTAFSTQPVGVAPTGIAIDRTGALMAVDNTGSGNISLLAVGSGGALTPDTPPTIGAGNNPILLVFYNAP